MAGISNVTTGKTALPASVAPSAAGGSTAEHYPGYPVQQDSFTSTIRMATPAIKFGVDHFKDLQNVIGGSGGGVVPTPAPLPPAANYLAYEGEIGGAVTGGAGEIGGAVGGAVGNIGSTFLNAFKGALKSNFIVSAIVSGATNLFDVLRGKTSPTQAMATFVADTAAYTGIGATSTAVGAVLGTLIPIPFVGTLLGVAAGLGLGWLYEKTIRKTVINATAGLFGGQPNPPYPPNYPAQPTYPSQPTTPNQPTNPAQPTYPGYPPTNPGWVKPGERTFPGWGDVPGYGRGIPPRP